MSSETLKQDKAFLIANTASGIFCRPGCSASGAGSDQEREFESAREALAAGFRPCARCKPLQSSAEDPSWLNTLMDAVDEDPARRWHDQDLAGKNMDPATVRRWFIANQGLTFHAYTRLRRLGLWALVFGLLPYTLDPPSLAGGITTPSALKIISVLAASSKRNALRPNSFALSMLP